MRRALLSPWAVVVTVALVVTVTVIACSMFMRQGPRFERRNIDGFDCLYDHATRRVVSCKGDVR